MVSPRESVETQVAGSPVVVYSKSYCPYCTKTKTLLNELGVHFVLVELDQIADGDAIQDALAEITGQRTVPNVFIGGKSVGGNSDVQQLHKNGQLVPLLKQHGALYCDDSQMGTDQSKSDGEHTNVEKEPDLVQILLALTILDSIAPDLEGSTVDSEKHATPSTASREELKTTERGERVSCVKAPPSKLLRQALGFEKLGFLDQLFTSALGVCPRSWRARSGKGGDSDPWKKHESAQAMLPALSTKPKQAVRQVKGLTNDSIDAYANTPMGGGGVAGNTMTSYADNTEGSGTARASPPSTTKPAGGSGRNTARKSYGGDGEEPFTSGLLARVVRDRKASGDEELTLKAGDVVHVLSTKRTGYLRCEFGDDVGYVPSSYLEFFDENGNGGDAGTDRDNADESQRSEKRKKKKEKRQKEKKLVGGDDPEETVVTTARSPRKTNGDHREASHPAEEGNPGGDESSRKSKKKHKEPKKHRHHAKQDDDDDDALAAKRGGGDDTERRKGGKKHSSKKKRHHDSSESSESDEDSRHRKGRRHRSHRRRGRGHGSDSESSSSYYSSSDSGYRRSRRRHRHRKGSSEEDDYDTDKRKAKRHGRRRDHGGSGSEVDDNETPRSPRRNDKKRRDDAAADPLVTSPRKEKDTTTNGVEKGIAKLDVQTEKPSSRNSEVISSHTPDQDIKQTASTTTTEKSGGSSARTKGKDDEGRTESTVTAHKAKTNLGKQIGEKMRSLLGGGKKTERSHKSSSGILNACPGTTQGEEGWYEHGENERYYFVLLDGKWSLLYGPMTEDDFETYSNKVADQNRMVELPPTYLHKAGYFLNQELRVQKV